MEFSPDVEAELNDALTFLRKAKELVDGLFDETELSADDIAEDLHEAVEASQQACESLCQTQDLYRKEENK